LRIGDDDIQARGPCPCIPTPTPTGQAVALDILERTLEDLVTKRGRTKGNPTLNDTAAAIGAGLGRVAARLAAWQKQRAILAAEIQALATRVQALVGDAAEATGRGFAAARAASSRGGRPKGYKVSPATRAKLRAAWKRRKAAASRSAKDS
jgi:hypothetical protein